jgi:hypothetical protein
MFEQKNRLYKFSHLQEKNSNENAIAVIYQNKEIKLPFNLKELDYFVNSQGEAELFSHPNHHRAAWLPDIEIGDR